MDPFGGSTNHNTQAYIKKVSNSTFNIGVKKCDAAIVYSPTVYSVNTTYLIVLKYTFVAGSGNDSAKIFAFSSGIPLTEPSVPLVYNVYGTDVSDIGELIITNSYASSGLQGSRIRYDGFRVGTSWSSALFTELSYQLNFTGLFQGFYNESSNIMITDTARAYLRYNFSPYAIVDSARSIIDGAGNGTFNFHTIVNNQYYYIVIKHRNSIETWSSASPEFLSNHLNYNFTTGDNQFYGYNAIRLGNKYCFYSGDVNQDGAIDGSDMSLIDNDALNYLPGYVKTDVNGDLIVDGEDGALTDNNAYSFVNMIRP